MHRDGERSDTLPTIEEQQVGEFLSALASSTPTPAGGSAAAITAAQGAALLHMGASFALTKADPAALADDSLQWVQQAAEDAARTGATLRTLADQDAAAFQAVLAAYRLPRDGDTALSARTAAIQKAWQDAVQIPYLVAASCRLMVLRCLPVARACPPSLVGDVLAALQLLRAGWTISLNNMRINLTSIQDSNVVAEWEGRRLTLEAELIEGAQAVETLCAARLGWSTAAGER